MKKPKLRALSTDALTTVSAACMIANGTSGYYTAVQSICAQSMQTATAAMAALAASVD